MSLLGNIETFVIAVRAGSFAAAARQLDISPAMVGRRIQSLEAHFSTKLIERTTRSQRLTLAGETMLARAEILLAAADELEQTITGERTSLSGRVRITGPTTLGIRRLCVIIAEFRQQHPQLIAEISLSDRQVDLIAEGFDFAVRIGALGSSSLIARRIGTYHFAVVASPDYVARQGLPLHPNDLLEKDCIINLNMRPRNRWPFSKGDDEVQIDVREGLNIDNGEAQLVAALDGHGLAYLPRDLVCDELAAGRLVEALDDWTKFSFPIQIVRPTRHLVPNRVTALMDAIAERFAQS